MTAVLDHHEDPMISMARGHREPLGSLAIEIEDLIGCPARTDWHQRYNLVLLKADSMESEIKYLRGAKNRWLRSMTIVSWLSLGTMVICLSELIFILINWRVL